MDEAAALMMAMADRIDRSDQAEKTDKTVPKALLDHQIFQDPKAPVLWGKLRGRADLPEQPWEKLGSGTRGTAFGTDGKVLKVTNDRTEAVAAALVRDNPDPIGNVYRVFSVWRLIGQNSQAFALVQERLDLMVESDPWSKFADYWPDWSHANSYESILPTTAQAFLQDCEETGLIEPDSEEWPAFKVWLLEVARYLESVKILYHDFWHRNLLVRRTDDQPDQHVLIDLGYSESTAKREPDIGVLARFRVLASGRGSK